MKFWHRLTLIATLVVAVLSIAALIAGVVFGDLPSSHPNATAPAPGNARASTGL